MMWDVPAGNMSYFSGHIVRVGGESFEWFFFSTTQSPTTLREFFFNHSPQDACTSGAWAASGRFFVTTSDDGALLVWSPKSQEITQRFDGASSWNLSEIVGAAKKAKPYFERAVKSSLSSLSCPTFPSQVAAPVSQGTGYGGRLPPRQCAGGQWRCGRCCESAQHQNRVPARDL